MQKEISIFSQFIWKKSINLKMKLITDFTKPLKETPLMDDISSEVISDKSGSDSKEFSLFGDSFSPAKLNRVNN